MRILLDTNIILRNVAIPGMQHDEVADALNRLTLRGDELCVGTQNIMEFWVVATRPQSVNGFGLTPDQARQEVDIIMRTFIVLRDTSDLLELWLDLCSRYAVSGRPAHDARLVALMLAHNVTHLLSLDPGGFARYTEITCLQPADV